MTGPDREWLRSPEGRSWLESDEGVEWLTSTQEGIEWSESADGREWFDEGVQRGFEDYFTGRTPAPPDWGLTRETAPRIGDRVRLVEAITTMGEVSFAAGELLIVSEMKLAPIGVVMVTLRTVDGRKLLTGMRGTFVPATS